MTPTMALDQLYLIRFVQTHETFRRAEIEALGCLVSEELTAEMGTDVEVEVEVVRYDEGSPFCVVRFVVGPRGSLEGIEKEQQQERRDFLRSMVDLNDVAKRFVAKSIQSKAIYELWGWYECFDYDEYSRTATGSITVEKSYSALHADVERRSRQRWQRWQQDKEFTFKFSVDVFGGKRSDMEKREIMNGLGYLGFGGKIRLKGAQEEWTVFEEWEGGRRSDDGGGEDTSHEREEGVSEDTTTSKDKTQQQPTLNSDLTLSTTRKLKSLFFGRKLGESRRHLCDKHDLKQRPYISTTSMDAELALITVNLALAAPRKLFMDPFCGTGGFMVAAAELGAAVMGSDIDGRSFRGIQSGNRRDARGRKGVSDGLGLENGLGRNLKRYGLEDLMGDCFTADLVNTPLRLTGRRWLDGIVCDPPYGVREGLKVLGTRKGGSDTPSSTLLNDGEMGESNGPVPHMIKGVLAHTRPDYVAPKKPYSFQLMLDDILDFAARTLLEGGRFAFWMPSANFDEETGLEEVTAIPRHPQLELKHECVQRFNKWSRRLLIYQMRAGVFDDEKVVNGTAQERRNLDAAASGHLADDLNPFRRRYFQAFVDRLKGPDG